MQLFVDLTEAPRNIFHSKMTIPVKPGAFTLVYPKWIPGNHRPSGPIANFTGLRIEASGKPVAWQRDDEDMYAFHVDVPPVFLKSLYFLTPLRSMAAPGLPDRLPPAHCSI